MIRKKLYAAVLAAAVSASVIPAGAAAEGTVLRETVLYSWDFASADQTSAEENEKDIPVLYGAAEYAEDTANIRLNHKNGASGVKTELSVPVTAETSENIITVEFDLNIGSGSGLYYTYRIEGSGGEPVAELHFTPYSSSDTTAYLRIGGNDVVFDETDGNGDIITTVNQQIKNCISSETSDGMNAAVTHIKNVIDLTEGSAEVTISSGTKSGTFTGEISAQDIALLDMNVNKVNHSRYIYLDNIRISQLRNVERTPVEELVHRITAEADGELTQIDTSRLVYGDHVSMMSITTSSEGRLVTSYTTGLADSVTVDTSDADTVEIVPVYEYTGLEDTAFNTAEGAELEAPNALGIFEDARYDISLQKADGKLTDIYINGAMVGNNIEQTGRGRGTPKGSLYTAKI